MRFYTQSHQYYCGIDLHARSLYVCILAHDGTILVHKDIKANPERLLSLIAPYRDDIVVGVECMFSWYWVADLCRQEKIPFILGHALYMRGGMFPLAYVYPREMRGTRDLMRRRMHLMRKRSELLAHVHNTNSQYNLPEISKNLRYAFNREGIKERFDDPSVQKSIELDLNLIDFYDKQLSKVEWHILNHARSCDHHSLMLLRSVPGIGNAYLKWAFSEAAVLFLRGNPEAQAWLARLASKHNKARALTILAHKLGRAVYFMLQRKQVFDQQRFLNG